ncbi:MFS transporter [Orbus sturtevantii]|uniref:MFS transporter n=1 Tax=Orbus sturtevantii TaxID=3074109 RepID=UPI00370D8731
MSTEEASKILSFYFFAFAIGVVFWGRICDLSGRRFAIIAGLLLYDLASMIALYSRYFEELLLARMLTAFGAAVGSIVDWAFSDKPDSQLTVMALNMTIQRQKGNSPPIW